MPKWEVYFIAEQSSAWTIKDRFDKIDEIILQEWLKQYQIQTVCSKTLPIHRQVCAALEVICNLSIFEDFLNVSGFEKQNPNWPQGQNSSVLCVQG